MKYFVLSNLNHNGTAFKRGDSIELADEFAKPLLEAKVIQAESVEVDVLANAPVVEKPKPKKPTADKQVVGPVVGGEEIKTGEPSVDGRQEDVKKEAEDVSPIIDPVANAPVVDPSDNL